MVRRAAARAAAAHAAGSACATTAAEGGGTGAGRANTPPPHRSAYLPTHGHNGQPQPDRKGTARAQTMTAGEVSTAPTPAHGGSRPPKGQRPDASRGQGRPTARQPAHTAGGTGHAGLAIFSVTTPERNVFPVECCLGVDRERVLRKAGA